MNNHDKDFLKCLERWSDELIDYDERICHAFDAYNELCERININQMGLTLNLLGRFSYYSRESANAIIAKLSQKAKEDFNLNNDNTIVSSIRAKNGIINSSTEYILIHKNVGDFSKRIHYMDLNEITEEQWSYINNIILVDDFSGTGKTIKEYLGKNIKLFKHKKIVIILVEIMRNAIKNIKKYAMETGLDIRIVSFKVNDKALKNETESTITEFEKLSDELSIPFRFVKGWCGAEALVAFFDNTPNNTLGMFWYDTNTNNSLFPRRNDEKPSWQFMKKEREKRKRTHYESKIK